MRTRSAVALTLAALLTCAAAARAGAREDALAILDQAVKAHGGEAALAKLKNSVRTGEGTFALAGNTVPFKSQWTVSLPERSRLDFELQGQPRRTTLVDGARVGLFDGVRWFDASKETTDEAREELYVVLLTTLLPLKGDGFELEPAGEVQVNGRPALTVRATGKGHRDVVLYFDKETHLLVKAKRRAAEGGLPVDKEYFYGQHREFDGVRLPAHYAEHVNGKKLMETSVEWKLPSKLDDSVFERK